MRIGVKSRHKLCGISNMERKIFIFCKVHFAAPWEGRIPNHPALNTSSTGSSGCSRSDRLCWQFKHTVTGRATWRHLASSPVDAVRMKVLKGLTLELQQYLQLKI